MCLSFLNEFVCRILKDQAIGFLDAVAPPDEIIGSPLGAADGDIYKKYLA